MDIASRRDLLKTLGGSGLTVLAGCNTAENSAKNQSETTDTVVFTNGDAEDSDANTTSETASRSSETTEPPVFDGGGTRDFVEAIELLNKVGGGTLEIEPGTYQFDEISGQYPSGPHASLTSPTDLTIQGNGATIEFTNPTMMGLEFVDGANLTIRDLTFDYRPVPFSQGEIIALSREQRTLRVRVDEGFPSLAHEMFDIPNDVTALIHRPDGEFIRGVRKRGRWDAAMAAMTRIEPGVFELELTDDSSWTGLKKGRRLTVLARNNRSALYFYKIDGLELEEVTVRAANGAAIGTGVCTDPVFRNCVIAPPPNSNRQISADADGIRVINAMSSTSVEGCRHEKLGDDSLVVQHTLGKVTDIEDDRTVTVKDTHPFVVAESDRLDGLTPTGREIGLLPTIESLEYWHESFPGERGKPERITFEDPISDRVSVGDFLRNLETGSQNFTIRNNEFREHRANLIRIASSKGVIEDNILVGCSINPIELETDTAGHFAPKGWVRDVIVQNNTIARPGLSYVTGSSPAGIRVHHRPAPGTPTRGRPNRNITIRNNTVKEGASLGIEIDAAKDVRIEGNDLSALSQLDFGPLSRYGIGIDHSANVTVVDNEVSGTKEELLGFGWYRDSTEVIASSNFLRIGGNSKSADFVEWTPLTLEYDKTVSWSERNPESSDDRPLAVFCFEIKFMDGQRTSAVIDVGAEEGQTLFEKGAYTKTTEYGDTGRWFGGPGAKTVMYFPAATIQNASKMELHGLPMDESISMTASIDGDQTDTITFGTTDVQRFSVDLE